MSYTLVFKGLQKVSIHQIIESEPDAHSEYPGNNSNAMLTVQKPIYAYYYTSLAASSSLSSSSSCRSFAKAPQYEHSFSISFYPYTIIVLFYFV